MVMENYTAKHTYKKCEILPASKTAHREVLYSRKSHRAVGFLDVILKVNFLCSFFPLILFCWTEGF